MLHAALLTLAAAAAAAPLDGMPHTPAGAGADATDAAVLASFSPRVKQLLDDLTLEDKIGQMCQVDIDLFVQVVDPRQLDEDRTREFFRQYRIGSILNSPAAARPNAKLSPREFHSLVTQIQRVAIEEGSRVPILYGIDSIHGGTYIQGSTLFPQQFGLAASFNLTLAEITGEVTAKDTRASGLPWNFGPVLDLALNPIWSRVWETFGEDPYLASEFGVAHIKGQQGFPRELRSKTKVAATAKHFIGYGAHRGGDRTPAFVPDRQMYEYLVPTFDAAINRADVATTMEAYNEVNGIPVASSRQYLVDLLRNELGFEGLLVTDWSEINNLSDWHKIAPTRKDGVKIAMEETSIDMSMIALGFDFFPNLLELVQEGLINETRVDVAAGRILALKEELGLLDQPIPELDEELINSIGSDEDRAMALATVRESVTLLKNENNILPLGKGAASKVLVAGPTGDSLRFLTGGWSLHHQGAYNDDEFAFGWTIVDGVREVLKNTETQVAFAQGCEIDSEACEAELLDEAVAQAADADVIVLALGEKSYCEKPGDIFDAMLSAGQRSLAHALAATGKPIVLVLSEGRARVLGGIENLADAIVMAYLPGPEGGLGIAEILFGDVNPSGRLPITYPEKSSALPIPYYHRHSEEDSYFALYPFGHGLSYSEIAYADLRLSAGSMTPADTITVAVRVTNLSSRSAKESVLMYLSDEYRIITPEVKMLKGFTKIELAAGESADVSFAVTAADLTFYGVDNTPQVEAGMFTVAVGGLEQRFELVVPGASAGKPLPWDKKTNRALAPSSNKLRTDESRAGLSGETVQFLLAVSAAFVVGAFSATVVLRKN